ncbi:MAG: EamA family transporter [Alphaproteobacteria bacterium]|nr:EamA family transporter [Alphaproteobacteria bacterium]
MGFLDVIAAAAVALFWGMNFVAAKLAMTHFPPMLMSALRFALVAAILLPLTKMPRGRMKEIFLVSTTLGTLHFSLAFTGMYMGLDASTSALISQLGVPFSCLLGALFLDDKLGWRRTLGMAIAFAGILFITGTPNVSDNLLGFALVVGGSFCWSIANIQIKKMGKIDIMPMLGWVALFSAPQLLAISLVMESGQWETIRTATPLSLMAIGYSVIFSTIVAYGLWYRLLSYHPVTQVAPFNLLVPVFGVTSGVLVLGEPLTWQIMVGGLITMAGVAIIVLRRPKIVEVGRDV